MAVAKDRHKSRYCHKCVPVVAIDRPVGAGLHEFWEIWAALGTSPKVTTVLREGYTLLFWIRPNLTRSPTIISGYVHTSGTST